MKRKFSQFGYDARSELTSATLGNAAYGYGFDEAGNRNSATEAGRQLAYTTNALNQYASVSEGETSFVPEYDLDGNATRLRTSTGTWSVEYNAHNRPVSWRKTTGEVVYMIYDAQGRRAEKRVLNASGKRTLRERYVYVGYTCVQVLNGDKNNALVKEFAWDPTEPTATRPLTFRYAEKSLMLFYAFDGNKNVSDVFFLALQNGIGAHYEYAPFGAVTRTSKATGSKVDLIGANPWRFSSEFYDTELDLVYYNYRHYSPAMGRWLSRDPIQEQGGLNLYAFTSNAPIVQIDILGEIVPAPGCHLNSPTCGGNGKVGIENPFPESWQTALIDFLRWWNGTHPQESNYGPDSQETKDLMESEIARRLREAFREKNQGRKCSDWKGLSGAGLKFGPIRFIKDIPNGRAHFVGSADGDVSIKIDSENCKVVATFVLENTTSLESFLYHLWFVENIEEPGLPRSNWVQRYTWQEEYECKKCDEEDL